MTGREIVAFVLPSGPWPTSLSREIQPPILHPTGPSPASHHQESGRGLLVLPERRFQDL